MSIKPSAWKSIFASSCVLCYSYRWIVSGVVGGVRAAGVAKLMACRYQ